MLIPPASRHFLLGILFSNPPSSTPRKQQKQKDHGSVSSQTQETSEFFFDIRLVMAEAIDLTGDGGVLKTVIKEAKADAIAPSDSLPLVDVHYEGTLAENGEVFDTTYEDNSVFSFEITEGTVIKAWDVAVKTMKVGEVAKITCKPEYAYGAAGSPPEIPPDATLIFEVELVACRPRKGSSVESVSEEKARLEELRKQRETAAGAKEEEKRKREEAKATAAARVQAKLEAKKGKGKKAK